MHASADTQGVSAPIPSVTDPDLKPEAAAVTQLGAAVDQMEEPVIRITAGLREPEETVRIIAAPREPEPVINFNRVYAQARAAALALGAVTTEPASAPGTDDFLLKLAGWRQVFREKANMLSRSSAEPGDPIERQVALIDERVLKMEFRMAALPATTLPGVIAKLGIVADAWPHDSHTSECLNYRSALADLQQLVTSAHPDPVAAKGREVAQLVAERWALDDAIVSTLKDEPRRKSLAERRVLHLDRLQGSIEGTFAVTVPASLAGVMAQVSYVIAQLDIVNTSVIENQERWLMDMGAALYAALNGLERVTGIPRGAVGGDYYAARTHDPFAAEAAAMPGAAS